MADILFPTGTDFRFTGDVKIILPISKYCRFTTNPSKPSSYFLLLAIKQSRACTIVQGVHKIKFFPSIFLNSAKSAFDQLLIFEKPTFNEHPVYLGKEREVEYKELYILLRETAFNFKKCISAFSS